MNLTTLRATIRAYAENDFPQTVGSGGLTSDEQVDTFIRQAEQRIYNSVQFPSIRKNVTGTTTPGNKYLATPVDFLASYSIAVIDPVTTDYEFLLNKDVNFIRAAYPKATDSGTPAYYALFDENTFILGPTPDAAYTMELHYYYYPASIVDAGTSWLGDNFDSVLIYGSLLEAASFMKSDVDTIKNYTERYGEALLLAKRLGDGMDRSDAYRSGQFRMPNLPSNTGVL
jgi:hypothetical protein